MTAVYDGDGNRVQATVDGVATVYIGGYYEETAGTVRTYYYHGGQRVAMREAGVTTWLLSDHLGSTNVTYSEASGETAGQRYYAWGGIRPGPENELPTDYTFTGQRLDAQTNLYHMGARWYDPVSGRWISADSIVPVPGNPQSLNRFGYAANNPYRYTDPTGHVWWIPIGAAVGALVGGGIAYGVQVAANMDRGMDLRQALTADIDADKIRRGVAAGGIVGTLIGTGVGLVATSAPAAGAGTTAAGVATGVANAAVSDDGGASELQAVAQLGNEAADAIADAGVSSGQGLQQFSQAWRYGIGSYLRLRVQIAGTGLRAHHLIEQRFAQALGLDAGEIPSIALTPAEHQVFTNLWRQEIGYDNMNSLITTSRAGLQDVWRAAQAVYAGHPELLDAVRQFLGIAE